jgi:hypothetical protein
MQTQVHHQSSTTHSHQHADFTSVINKRAPPLRKEKGELIVMIMECVLMESVEYVETSGQFCPICEEELPLDADEFDAHMDHCLGEDSISSTTTSSTSNSKHKKSSRVSLHLLLLHSLTSF